MSRIFTVTIDVEVHDAAALYDTAVAAAQADQYPDPAEILGTREEPDVGACLQYVFDPGAGPDGTEILGSTAETLPTCVSGLG